MHHIISWSGGKDSTASVILFHEHMDELVKNPAEDDIVILFCEVFFDKKNGISGHHPAIISFVHETKKVFESWGFEVHFVSSDTDYLDVFYHKLTNCPEIGRAHV